MTPPDGRHLSFPFRIAQDGQTAQVATLEEHVRDELMQLILTNPGERAFLPEFGGGVRKLVFENAGETTAAMTKAMLNQALSKWLGQRLTVENLDVAAQNETITVEIQYRIVGTDEQRQIRFERQER